MEIALEEARKGLGHTSPNPAVGAILVIGNKVVAKGHHSRAGGPHAEIECLRSFRTKVPKQATMYVTLEPCSTAGRTPPCTKAIIAAGVTKIVFGAFDPNPKHEGRACAVLRQAWIAVETGVLAEECSLLNETYNKWSRLGQPFVIAKCGMSLDGRLTRPPHESRWLTSPASRKHAQKLRACADAILVGAKTVRADNPRLTVRGTRNSPQPWRAVLTRSGQLPRTANLFTDRWADRTLIYRNQGLKAVLRDLGKREVTSVLIEGGGDVLGQALDARVIDKVQLYLAPILTGGPVLAFAGKGAASTKTALRLTRMTFEKIGDDLCVTGYPKNRNGD
jgi:diaminohydroxyphosphoribosylaminopyrimidine deaminase/5-amino-6-(5-phosphoribosylamino)uracil reductase